MHVYIQHNSWIHAYIFPTGRNIFSYIFYIHTYRWHTFVHTFWSNVCNCIYFTMICNEQFINAGNKLYHEFSNNIPSIFSIIALSFFILVARKKFKLHFQVQTTFTNINFFEFSVHRILFKLHSIITLASFL